MPIATWVDGVLGGGVSPLDPGFLYGESVFETMRARDGRVIDLDAHVALLDQGARAIAIRVPPFAHLRAALAETIAAADEPDLRVRVIVTAAPAIVVTAEPCPPLGIRAPLTLAIVDRPLVDARTLDPSLKTGAYLDHRLAIRDGHADESIRLTLGGLVASCATANLFAVIDGALVTPPASLGIRRGTVRARVLADAGARAREQTFTGDDLARASELFVTSSIRGVAPARLVTRDTPAPGPVTQQLADAYLAFAMRDMH
ncbi:MAG TPA: aminotransferase class IV [Kofleriaceae bacterium]|nr:aminotransferase class IV [Kofleriaceae bacterium]